MKNSFSILEIILSILLATILIVSSAIFLKDLHFTNKNSQNIEIYKIDMLSAKAFLEKQKDFDKYLVYNNKTLFFKNNTLLENVDNFKITKKETYIEIDILINKTISQTWKIPYE